jgi:hypothetical protein
MNLNHFPEANIVFGANQPEYRGLPAYKVPRSGAGEIVCCWPLSWRERLRVLFSGRVWHTILTFNEALQPQLLDTRRPALLDAPKGSLRS